MPTPRAGRKSSTPPAPAAKRRGNGFTLADFDRCAGGSGRGPGIAQQTESELLAEIELQDATRQVWYFMSAAGYEPCEAVWRRFVAAVRETGHLRGVRECTTVIRARLEALGDD